MSDAPLANTYEIIVPRTSRYAVLGAGVSGVEEVWLACHGYGQLASRFIRRFAAIDNGKRLIVAPEALSRFYLSGSSGPHSRDDRVGASWMTRESRDSEIADQVTYLDMVCGRVLAEDAAGAKRLVAFGFSQGAAAVSRWATTTVHRPERMVLWGAGLPNDVLEGRGREALERIRLTIVAGSSDPVIGAGAAEAHARQLETAGITYRLVTYEGGHEIDAATLAALAAEIGDS